MHTRTSHTSPPLLALLALGALVAAAIAPRVHAAHVATDDAYAYEGTLTGTWESADGQVVAALCHDLHDVWPADVNRTVEWLFMQHNDGRDGAGFVWRDTSADGGGALVRVQGSVWRDDGTVTAGALNVAAVDEAAATLELDGVLLTRTNASAPASCPAAGRASLPVPTRGRKWRMSGAAFGDDVLVYLCRTAFHEQPYDVRGYATLAGGDSVLFFAQTFGVRAVGEYVHYTPTGVAASGTLTLVYDAWESTGWTATLQDASGAPAEQLVAVQDEDDVAPSPMECHDLLALDGVAHHGGFGVDEGEQLSLVRVTVTWSGFFFNPLWARLHHAEAGEPLRVDAVQMAVSTQPQPEATEWVPDTTPWTDVAVDVPVDDVWFAALRAQHHTTVHTLPGADLLAPQTYYAGVRVPHGAGLGEFPLTLAFQTLCSVARCNGGDCACAQSPNGTCTRCPWGFFCSTGACSCEAQCDGKQCGDNGCGGLCGTCGEGTYCTDENMCAPVSFVGTWQAYMYTGTSAQLHVCENEEGIVTGMLQGSAWASADAQPFFIGLDEPFTRNAGTAWWFDPNATTGVVPSSDAFAYSMLLTNRGTIEFTAESTAAGGAPTGARTGWLAERISSAVPPASACTSPHVSLATDFSGEFTGVDNAAWPEEDQPAYVCMWGLALRARVSTGFFQGACTEGAGGPGTASCRGHWYRGALVGDFAMDFTQPAGLGTWAGWTCAGSGCAVEAVHDEWRGLRVATARPDVELCVDPRAGEDDITGVWDLTWSSDMLLMNPPDELTLCPGLRSDVFGQFSSASLHLFGHYVGHTLDALLLHNVMPSPPTLQALPFEVDHNVAGDTFEGVWRDGASQGSVTGTRVDEETHAHAGCSLANEVEAFAGVWEDMSTMDAMRACQRNGQVAATLGATVYIGEAALWGAHGVWRRSTAWGMFTWVLTNPGERAATTLRVREWEGNDPATVTEANYMALHNTTEASCTTHLGAALVVEGEWTIQFGSSGVDETVHLCQEFARVRGGWARGWLEGTVENGVAHGVWANEQESGTFLFAFTARGDEVAGSQTVEVGATAGTPAARVEVSGSRVATARPSRDACVRDVHAGLVFDGPLGDGLDQDFQTSGDEVSASWAYFFSKRGAVSLEWAAGTSEGASDVVPWTGVASGTTHARRSGLNVADGTTVYASVRATDMEGNVVVVSSDGVMVRSRVSLQLPNVGEATRTGLVDVADGDAFLATVRVPAGLANGFTHVDFGALDAGDHNPHDVEAAFGGPWAWHSVRGITFVVETSGATGGSNEWMGSVGLDVRYGTDFDASGVQIGLVRLFRYDAASDTFVDATPDSPLSVRACASSLAVDEASGTVHARVCSAGQYALFAPDKDVPFAPTTLRGAAEVSAVTLSWENPATGGHPILSYVVQMATRGTSDADFGDVQEHVPFASAPSYRVANLAADTAYMFRVAARNTLGLGPYEVTTVSTLPGPSPTPGPGGGTGSALGAALGVTAAVCVVVLVVVWWRRRQRPAWQKRGVFGRGGRRRDMMSDDEGAAFIAYAGAVPPSRGGDGDSMDGEAYSDGSDERRALPTGDLGDMAGDGVEMSQFK